MLKHTHREVRVDIVILTSPVLVLLELCFDGIFYLYPTTQTMKTSVFFFFFKREKKEKKTAEMRYTLRRLPLKPGTLQSMPQNPKVMQIHFSVGKVKYSYTMSLSPPCMPHIQSGQLGGSLLNR